MNKKTVAKAIVASIIAMNIYGVAFAAPGDGGGSSNTRQNIKVETKTDADGIKNPDLNHTYFGNGDHNNVCGELIDNTDLTIGQINTVVDDLVANDKKLMSDIKKEAEERKAADAAEAKAREDADKVLDEKINAEAAARANGDIVGGEVKDSKISLIKGDGSTIDLDVSGITAGNDTYIEDGSYDGDSQKITLKRNDGEDIDITLDNVAKASDLENVKNDVTNIDNRLTNVEGDVTDIKGDVTNIKTDITDIKGDINNIDSRVTNVEGDITNVKNDITNIKSDVTNITGDITNIKSDVTNIDNRVTNVEGNVNDLTERVTNNENNITNLGDRVTNVEGDVTNIKNDVTNVKNDITNIKSDVTNIDNRVTTVEGNVNDLTERVTNNENNIANLGDRVTNVEGDVTNVKNDITNIKSDVTDLQGEVITSGTFSDNTLDLIKDNGDKISVSGIASVEDVTAERNARESADKVLDSKIDRETLDRRNADNMLSDRLMEETKNRMADDAELNSKIINEEKARKDADQVLEGKINDEAKARQDADDHLAGMDIASGKMDGNTLVLDRFNQETIEIDGIATTGDIEGLNKEVEKTKETIKTETEERKSEDERLDSRIDGVQQDISDLNGRINKLDGKINKGVALAIAHASLKPLDYDPRYKWTGSMGVGNYHGENAVAAGAFYQPNKDLLLNFSISMCGSEKGVGAGVSVRFK